VVSFICLFVAGPLGGAMSLSQQGGLRHLCKFALGAFTLAQPHVAGAFARAPLPDVVDGSLWTVRYEFLCYVAVPLLGLLWMRPRKMLTGGLFLLFIVLYTLWRYGYLTVLNGRYSEIFGALDQWPHLATYFLAGSLFYLYRDRIPFSRRLFWISVTLVAITALLLRGLTLTMPRL